MVTNQAQTSNALLEQVDSNPFTILVVDDNPTNLSVIVEYLESENFTTLVAQDGESGLKRAKYAQPDLILLDVLMPGINGFETCRQLKLDPSTTTIPVIFMTALSSTEDKVKGFAAGAVDYITKPVQREELLARLKIHLKLQELSKALEEKNKLLAASNQLLEQQVSERTMQLTEAIQTLQHAQIQLVQHEKMSSLGQLVAGVAHEINNPVNFVHGNLNHVQEYAGDLLHIIQLYQKHYPNPVPEIQAEAKEIDLEFLQEDLAKILASMKIGTDRIRQIVLSLRNFSRMDEAEFKAVDIHEGIESTLMILQHRLKARPERPAIEVIQDYAKLPLVECYPGQLNQVMMNLLANAIDALEEGTTKRTFQETQDHPSQITIRTSLLNNQWVKIAIADNGPGIPEDIKERIFDPFFTTKPIGKGTGIGLSISYQIIVNKHDGKFECFSTPDQGTEFVIQIPIRQKACRSV